MSEKKSWDIQPKRKSVPQVPAAPPAQPRREAPREIRRAPAPRSLSSSTPTRTAPTRPGLFGKKKEKRITRPAVRPMSDPHNRTNAPLPAPAIRVVRPAPRTTPIPQGRDREPLKARRRRARQRMFSTLFILLILAVVGAFASFWFPAVRIQNVQVGGPDSQGMQTVSMNVIQGTYHYIVPRDSIFFFPENAIRTQILAQYPDISAVSISRVSFNTIAVISIPREAALTWCGPNYMAYTSTQAPVSASSTDVTSQMSSCYSADAEGIIFAPISDDEASSSDALKIYGPLAGNPDPTASPLGATIGQANLIPNALQFVKAIKSLGVPIVSLVIRGDEADLYAQSGTRITYVLGHEEVSAQLAESAFPSLNLNDGSLEYVDLRFEGKVYYKKVGDVTSTQATSTNSH